MLLSVAYQASNIKAISKGSDHSVHMRFIEMLRRAIIDLFCFGAKSRGVCLFLRRIRKLTSK